MAPVSGFIDAVKQAHASYRWQILAPLSHLLFHLRRPGAGLALSLKAEAIACLLVAASGAILSTHIPKPTQKNTVFT